MIEATKPEVVESEADKSARMAKIESFATIVKDKRKDAINGRRASGIETIWQEDEDAYEGVDKYNMRYGTLQKSRSVDGSLTETKKVSNRSTVIPNITRPYCDAAAARVSDMLLPTDNRNWAIRPTPNPTLINSQESTQPAIGPDGQPITRPVQPAAAPGMMSRISSTLAGVFNPQQQPVQPTQQPVTVGEMAEQAIAKAKKSAERAQTVIDDWHVECEYQRNLRKVIESAARMGTGILKGPHPTKKNSRVGIQTPEGWKLSITGKINPASLAVNVWNFYPDPNCGDDIQKGSYCLERDDITLRGLADLKGGDYIDDMIDLCIADGPISSVEQTSRKRKEGEAPSDKELFEIWYFHGVVSKADMLAAGCACEADSAPCTVTMVNDRIIKITQSVLDSGEFPYDVMVWQEKVGHWAGIGVARQIRTCQKGLTGAVRAMQDNSGVSSGPQIIIDSSKIEPADGKWHITPLKVWRKKQGSEAIDDVSKAFTIVGIETRQVELLNIINYWTKTAEDVTGLPMLLQGQQGGAPETLGATQIVNNNGSTVLRRIARTFDDRITIPHNGRYYEYLLLHGPEDAKGDYQIEARGSSALVERDIQNQAMMQLLGVAVNPAYMLDPEKVMQEVLKGMRLDPRSFTLDEQQKKAMAERKPPEDPRITAAKIMAQGKLEVEKLESEQLADHAVAEAHMEMQRQTFAREMKAVDERLADKKISQADRLALQKHKVQLAELAQKLGVQKDLAVASHSTDLHKHHNPQVLSPAVEPAGRAKAGEAFAK